MSGDCPLVLLSRPQASSERISRDLLSRIDLPVLVAPVIEIEPIGEEIDSTGFPTLILTSAHGAARTRPAPGKVAWCVGDATAEAAEAMGFAACSAGGDADELVARLLEDRPEDPLLHVRGEHGTGRIAERLREAGFAVEARIAYRQRDCPLSPDAQRRIEAARHVVAPVYSPRSARRLWEELRTLSLPRRLSVVAIGEAAGGAWAGPGEVIVAESPTGPAVLNAVIDAVGRDSPC